MLLLYSILVFCTSSAFSEIKTTPGVQRKPLQETCIFQWSVTGNISSYSVYNRTLGYSTSLNQNAYYALDSENEAITLTIEDIQLWDAGNYSLSLTTENSTESNADALLFVFGYSQSFVNQTYGVRPPPAVEGDAIELTCTVIPTSLPVAYRPRMYYFWQLSSYGTLQNISSGPATKVNGDLIPGYSIKNDGRTLVIASAQYSDSEGLYCYGREERSPYTSNYTWFNLSLTYRPHIISPSPKSRKFNAFLGNLVSLSFSFAAEPATSATNWSFVNAAGHPQDLPEIMLSYSGPHATHYHYLTFNLTSPDYYGTYSITIYNSLGFATETFQVLRPGPPDTPSNVRVDFVSHYLIAIKWNCMWFNGRQQRIFLQLKAQGNESIIDSWITSIPNDCYNSSYIMQFTNGIQPETNYKVTIWSRNVLGSSNVSDLTVKTPKIFKFAVSPKNISFNGSQAIVNISATEDKVAVLNVLFCLELTGVCIDASYYSINNSVRQIKVKNLPSGNAYVVDFYVYGGSPNGNTYYLAMVKGLKVSRTEESKATDDDKAAVTVLGVLFGLAVFGLAVCIILFLLSKCFEETEPNSSKPAQTRTDIKAPLAITQEENEVYEGKEGKFEAVDGVPSHDDTNNNTSLERNRYSKV